MEIAIPLLALGGLYVVSNEIKHNEKTQSNPMIENYTNMGKPKQNAYLTNTNIPPQNYPSENLSDLSTNVARYSNPNVATDKYFNQNTYENRVNEGKPVGQNIQQVHSLTGNYLESKEFKHNNMVPFYGGKPKGYTYDMNIAETRLDNMVGNGSQNIKKVEQAPLFKPEDNVQWAYGMPNQSDFFQSRVNPATKNNNVKPFGSEMVGPGLNQGYGTSGSGGFNSGMEARDKWLPYTVDELRVVTNPKLEYTLENLQGPANSEIKNRGIIGRVEKQLPDTFFINTQDRWLTTTGAVKAETLRPIQEMGIVKRADCPSDYVGVAGPGDNHAPMAPTNFEDSKRQGLGAYDAMPSNAAGRGPRQDGDNNIKSYTSYNNQRSTVRQVDTFRSGFSGAIGAVIAPLMDILRPSRKEEVVSNIRVYGEAGTAVPASYVMNPNDVAPTTVKETTLHSSTFNINNQREGMYVNTQQNLDTTQRDTTNCSYIGNVGGSAAEYGDMDYAAAYRQHNNDIKSSTNASWTNQGNTQIFNQQMNLSTIKADSDRFNYRTSAPSSVIKMPPSAQTYGNVNSYQNTSERDNSERFSPDLLNAFRENPYTHSLTTSV